MPTTRRRRARTRREDVLTANVIEVLLTGECADDPFCEFDFTLAELGQLYLAHKARLDAEFRRRKLPGKPWAATLTTQGDEGMRGTGR